MDTKKELAKIAGVSHDTIARGELALKRKHIIAAKAKENQGFRTDICQNSDKSWIDTKKELAKIAGVSHDTIARIEKIVQKAPEEAKENQGRRTDLNILENSPKSKPIDTRAPPSGERQERPTQKPVAGRSPTG